MVDFSLQPQQQPPQNNNAAGIIVQALKILESQIEALMRMVSGKLDISLRHTMQGNMHVLEGLSDSSISAPRKRRIRDEVCAYIDTLEKFDAKCLNGGYNNRLALIDYTLNLVRPGVADIALELGVFKGESLSLISQKCPGAVYGFDSFEGLPVDNLIWKKGQFNNPEGLAFQVGKNTNLVKGWFKDTLPGFVKETDMSKVAFVHIDCDIYPSAVEIFEILGPHLKPGIHIVFDEYWNYDGWKEGEFKAFQEFIKKTGRTYEYLGYMDSGNQVAIRLD